MRSKTNAPLVLSADEKKLVKEASKTSEYQDSLDIFITEASRIADLIRKAKHCVVLGFRHLPVSGTTEGNLANALRKIGKATKLK